MNPELLKPRLECIPSELRDAAQWVNWRAVWQGEKGKYNKPPIDPKTLSFAKSTDPATWASFEVAAASYERHQSQLAGVGFVLTAGDVLVGIDIDHCIEDGQVQADAQAIIDRFSSYTELSPSGTGIRIFLHGKLPAGGRKRGNLEIYDRDRYLTVTGHAIGLALPILERQSEIDSFYQELSPPTKPGRSPEPYVPSAGDFNIRPYARGLQGYHETHGGGGSWGHAKCPVHNGRGNTSFFVNLDTGAYGCQNKCTTEAIRAAIGHPKPEPPVTITDVKDWTPDERKRHLERFRSATAAQNAMNDVLYRAFTLAGYSNAATRMCTVILALVGQCEDGEICYRSRLAIANRLKLKGTVENKKLRVSNLLVELRREFAKSGHKPFTILPGHPKQSPGFVVHTYKPAEMADAMRRNHPQWRQSRLARYEATDAAALWLLEHWPEADPMPQLEAGKALSPHEYGDQYCLEGIDGFYDSRIGHMEEITFEDEVQFYEDKMLERLKARIASRRKTRAARTAIIDSTDAEAPMFSNSMNSPCSVKKEFSFSRNIPTAEGGKNGSKNGSSMVMENMNITALKSNADNTEFSNSVDANGSNGRLETDLDDTLTWEGSDEANT